ncbi:hypothetical protein [Pseudanabaena sp. PCC 6802]|uniref:hypothetical protein n=1 Tax=Pseudanabaena sp. PCC 6802 TaxID=118173 RepID=UPI00034BAC2A|nr:hypothetical protein [Pseudanabaena sp. PCC 6802]
MLLYAEEKWYAVSEGLLTDAEIHNLTLELKRRKQKAVNLYLSSSPLPDNKKYLTTAETKTEKYFKQNYLGGN